VLQARAEAAIRQHFHAAAEEIREVLLEADDVKQRTSGAHINKDVDVAVRPIVSAHDRAKDPDVPHAVAFGKREDYIPLSA